MAKTASTSRMQAAERPIFVILGIFKGEASFPAGNYIRLSSWGFRAWPSPRLRKYNSGKNRSV